ncbi:hypothetical protein GQ42DRAFT_164889, partial [Ramicandelaber brevisporus]
ARGGGESQRKRDEPRGGGEQMEHAAGKTRMPATPTWRQRDNHHEGPNTAPAHASTWGQGGNNACS